MKVLLFVIGVSVATSASRRTYTNTWCVKTFEGEEFAKQIAKEHGFSYHGLAKSYPDHYVFRKDDLEERSKTKRDDLTTDLMKHDKVLWAGQMKVKKVDLNVNDNNRNRKRKTKKEKKPRRSYRMDNGQANPGQRSYPTTPSSGFLDTYVGPTKNIILFSEKRSAYRREFNDDFWLYQWYAQDYRVVDGPVMDLNLVPVYRSGITGQGVTVAVVDSSVDNEHPDLDGVLNLELSHDFLRSTPELPAGERHGTNVAGVIAMIADNGDCGVGVAHGAKIAGLRALDAKGESTDLSHGSALAHAIGEIDIYSNSWHGDTEGKYIDVVDHMERDAIRRGVTEGRQNKGSIYVFGTGNLKEKLEDNCAFNGILNNRDIILVGAATNLGKVTPYAMACPNVFVTAYSGDGINKDEDDLTGVSEEGLVTTTVIIDVAEDEDCTTAFEGTSAAVPVVSGIVALVLQANPELGYRDVQHLITMSAEVAPLADNPGTWQRNGAGFWVSQDFGFGLINAQNMVELAKGWTNVGPQVSCVGEYKFDPPKQFSSEVNTGLSMKTDACENTEFAVTFLEKVELKFDLAYPGHRNDLRITLTSPQGTVVTMINPRPLDNSRLGIRNWGVTSVQTWGEDPRGNWVVIIENSHQNMQSNEAASSSRPAKRQKTESSTGALVGSIKSFKLTWHGLAKSPQHLRNGPRTNYAGFRV